MIDLNYIKEYPDKFSKLNSMPSLIKIVIALIQEEIVFAVSNIGSLSSWKSLLYASGTPLTMVNKA